MSRQQPNLGSQNVVEFYAAQLALLGQGYNVQVLDTAYGSPYNSWSGHKGVTTDSPTQLSLGGKHTIDLNPGDILCVTRTKQGPVCIIVRSEERDTQSRRSSGKPARDYVLHGHGAMPVRVIRNRQHALVGVCFA